MRVRSKCVSRLSNTDKQALGTGKLVNLIGTDKTNIRDSYWYVNYIVAIPLQVSLYLKLINLTPRQICVSLKLTFTC